MSIIKKNKTITYSFNVGVIFATLLFYNCSNNQPATKTNEKVIAQIDDNYLYESDIKDFSTQKLSSKDSTFLLNSIIDKWAIDELTYKEALANLSEDELNVEKQIDQYRKELINYKYYTKLITEQLDTTVSETEIGNYYEANEQNFLLKDNIVKVLYIKAPKKTPGIDKLKKLCRSQNPKDAEQLKSLCIQFADNYFMNDSTWLLFDDIKKEIPQLNETPSYSIKANNVFEFEDSLSFFFLKIKDIKTKNALSPLNFEKTNIKNIIINKRKLQLITQFKKELLETAKANKKIELK